MTIVHVRKLAWSVAEAAKILGISDKLVYEGITQKQIPSVHIGRRVLVPKIALAKWLEDSRMEVSR